MAADYPDTLELGKDNTDFAVSFDLLLTEYTEGWECVIHKGEA